MPNVGKNRVLPGAAGVKPGTLSDINAKAAAQRNSMRPVPGQPFGNVENSRCIKGPVRLYAGRWTVSNLE